MRNVLIFIAVIFISGSLSGQSAEETSIRLKQEGALQIEEQDPVNLAARPGALREEASDADRKGELGLSVGTGYSYSRGFGSGMMFYAAPTYTLPLNNRWALHTGFIASHYQGMNGAYGEFYTPLQYSSLAFFAAASYRMNDKLVLHGTGVKSLISAPITPFTPYPMDNLSLGATYKIGQNVTIGATIHLNNGRGYYANPYNGYHFNSPFFW
jgi:hypothetical protein